MGFLGMSKRKGLKDFSPDMTPIRIVGFAGVSADPISKARFSCLLLGDQTRG